MGSKVKSALRRARSESPLTLARELGLRLSRRWRIRRFRKQVGDPDCPVSFHPAGYYHPRLEGLSPQAKNEILMFAEEILKGRYPFLGYGTVNLGIEPAWNVDFVSGQAWAKNPSETMIVVRHDGSDVKAPWELSRLQFLPVMGKAFVLTGDERYRDAAKNLLTHWIDNNPVAIGVNWTIAMEAALRAMSICFLLELLWPLRPDEQPWLDRATASLWQHLLYIEGHNEFSHLVRSNHYLSNIAGLYVISSSLRGHDMEARRLKYAQKVEREILHQTYKDGADFEASSGYHLLVMQMFTTCLLYMRAQGETPGHEFRERLSAMYDWMAALAGEHARLPQIGDCDDGRIELLSDDLAQMLIPIDHRDSLHVGGFLGAAEALLGKPFHGLNEDAAWYGLIPPPQGPAAWPANLARVFPDAGIAVARRGDAELVFCAIPNGIRGAGSHTHNDKLGFVLRLGGDDLFCDSGTGAYTRDHRARNRFRSTVAHNVVAVDEQEQNTISLDPGQLFRLGNEAAVSLIHCESSGDAVTFRASHSGYQRLAVQHTRSITLGCGSLTLNDEFTVQTPHRFDLYFHLPSPWKVNPTRSQGNQVGCDVAGPRPVTMQCCAPVELSLSEDVTSISRAYSAVSPATRVTVRAAGLASFTIVSTIIWG